MANFSYVTTLSADEQKPGVWFSTTDFDVAVNILSAKVSDVSRYVISKFLSAYITFSKSIKEPYTPSKPSTFLKGVMQYYPGDATVLTKLLNALYQAHGTREISDTIYNPAGYTPPPEESVFSKISNVVQSAAAPVTGAIGSGLRFVVITAAVGTVAYFLLKQGMFGAKTK